MSDLHDISHGVLAGMLHELSASSKQPDVLMEAARRLSLMPSHKVATKVHNEVLANGAPDEIIAALITEITHLKRLLQEC